MEGKRPESAPGTTGALDEILNELRRAIRGSEHLFDALVGSLADPITIRDRHDRIVYANRAALEHLGFSSTAELRAVHADSIMADYVVTAEDGSPISMDDIPSVRILRGQAAEPLEIRTVHRHTGARRWNLLKASPLRDGSGAVVATIMIIEDITEQKLAQLRGALLARAGEVLSSSLDYEQTLRNVAELAVPEIADWCAVDLVTADGDRRPVAVAHVDPARLRLAEELRRYDPSRPDPEQGLGRVLSTGEPALFPEITDEMLQGAASDERHLELLRAVGMRSVAILPMRIGPRTLGAMTLVNAESGRALGDADLSLAQQIAERAAVAIENSRLYSERSRTAATLERSLLPEDLPEVPGYEFASVYIPAVEGSEVGGDFYEMWETDEGWMLAIGDVTGKGVEAAVLTALARHTLRAASEFVSSPAGLLSRLDHTLRKQRQTSICTALCVRLEPDRLVMAAGGHPLPLLVSADGVEQVGEPGPLLGAFPDTDLRDTVVGFRPGTTLVAYTDGVTDAVGERGDRFGVERLVGALERCRDCSAVEMIDELLGSLRRFQIGSHADDTAAVVIRRLDTATAVPAAAAGAQTGSSGSAR